MISLMVLLRLKARTQCQCTHTQLQSLQYVPCGSWSKTPMGVGGGLGTTVALLCANGMTLDRLPL